MTFLHITLLLGSSLAVIPILMHMLGKRQPKVLTFPALRFVRQTAITAQRGWSVKRWLLLILRTLLVLLIAFALASPRVHSSMFASYVMIGIVAVLAMLASAASAVAYGSRRPWYIGATALVLGILLWSIAGFWTYGALREGQPVPLANKSGPVCAAIVIDTSPTMAYRYHNMTRLEEAKEMARWLMDRLPVGSQIAIMAGDTAGRLNHDRLSAERQLDRVVVEGRSTNLIGRVSTAIDMLRRSDLERREVYVLTDMRTKAWSYAEQSDLPKKLATVEGTAEGGSPILVQIVDLSVPDKEIKNWGITNWKLSQDSTVPGGQVNVEADIRSVAGTGAEQIMCELATETVDVRLPTSQGGQVVLPTAKVSDHQLVLVPDGGSGPIRFVIKNLAEGTNHAEIRIVRSDPLELDNVVYLSIEARSQGQTAIVSDDVRDAQMIRLMIEPNAAVPEKKTDDSNGDVPNIVQAGPTVEKYEGITKLDLSKFSNIVLFNPSHLDDGDADRLLQWVDGGGGLLVVLGPGFKTADSLMKSGVRILVPGEVKRQTLREFGDRSTFLNPLVTTHAIWSIFERPINEIPWINYPVLRHWDIENLKPEAVEIMRFTDSDMPAIIEWARGQGRVVVTALPYPEPMETAMAQPWSELYNTSSDSWPGFALFLGTVQYLASQNKHPLNYRVDSMAVLDNNIAAFPKIYELYNPASEVVRVESADDRISYAFTKQPGQYRLRGLKRGPVVRGFSVNVDREEIGWERVSPDLVDTALGKGNYLVARDRMQVQSSLGEGRHGRELSPFLLVIVVMMVMAEQTMASRFYASSTRGGK